MEQSESFPKAGWAENTTPPSPLLAASQQQLRATDSNDDDTTEEMRWRIIRAYYPTENAARHYYETLEDTPSVLLVGAPEKIVSQDYND